MILADTSVWVAHLRSGTTGLEQLLEAGEVACHRFVVGELALGHLRNRATVLEHLARLPELPQAEHDEVFALIERRELVGKGIGWVDAHVLASCLLAHTALWTRDAALDAQAARLGLT